MSDEISGPKAAAPAEASGTEAEVVSTTVTATESSTTESSTAEASTTDPRTHRFECRSCGYVYDPAEGVKKLGIDSGTAFEDLDAIRFRCPVCRSKVGAFRDIGPSTKPSGFEENLNYGLGVNRLTPGQKNVLIFGSMALAFAFFLSLYSLR
nr:rubredoxin [Synechococcus sp. UW105]